MPKRVRAIIIEDGKVLLMHRIKNGNEYWAFPGGGLEESDITPEEGLKRECLEELGLDIEVGGVYMKKLSLSPDLIDEMEWFFNCKIIGGILGTGTGPEFTNRDVLKYGSYEIEWLSLDVIKDKNVYPLELRDKII